MSSLTQELHSKIGRVRGILPYYDEIPAGIFAASMMRQAIRDAELAAAKEDVTAMMRYLNELQGFDV